MSRSECFREHDIAYAVLDRRKVFDPANDNIVRSQFTHLRRKLEGYFLDEGKAETLIVKIPKGSYVPVFSPVDPVLRAYLTNCSGMRSTTFNGSMLPPDIVSILNRKELTYFELFLRGRHFQGQADSAFELVTVRTH